MVLANTLTTSSWKTTSLTDRGRLRNINTVILNILLRHELLDHCRATRVITHYFSTHGVCRVFSARDSKGGALGFAARLEVPFKKASIFPPKRSLHCTRPEYVAYIKTTPKPNPNPNTKRRWVDVYKRWKPSVLIGTKRAKSIGTKRVARGRHTRPVGCLYHR